MIEKNNLFKIIWTFDLANNLCGNISADLALPSINGNVDFLLKFGRNSLFCAPPSSVGQTPNHESRNWKKKSSIKLKKKVLERCSTAEIVLNHLVGPSEVPGGAVSNISMASTFVTGFQWLTTVTVTSEPNGPWSSWSSEQFRWKLHH